jgi:hypothetical protein
MRTAEIIAALIVACIAFVIDKLLGVVIHIAVVAGVLGLVAGFVIARLFRQG